MERNHKPNEDQNGVSVFTTLGTLVLTARPYESSVSRNAKPPPNTNSSERSVVDSNGASLQGEIFQIVNKEVNDVLIYEAKFISHLALALNSTCTCNYTPCPYSCLISIHYNYMYVHVHVYVTCDIFPHRHTNI